MSFLFLSMALVLAQTPAPKAAASPKTAAPAAAKTAAKTAAGATAAVRPAAAKPAVAKPAVARPVVPAKPAAPAVPQTDELKTIYAIGLSIYRSLGQFDLNAEELAVVQQAIQDAAAKKPAVELSEWGPKLQGLVQARQGRQAEKEKQRSAEYIAKAAGELGVLKTESGILYKEIAAGTGANPKASDTVKVHYRGTLIDGTEFDSSYKRNEPAQFPLGNVIPCWTEGVQKMKVGGKARLVCPANLAYGDSGRPSIPGGAALIFEIELLEIAAGN
jgi:FKBP-type peptidyl-prolyl cis-trans isomerase FkpA